MTITGAIPEVIELSTSSVRLRDLINETRFHHALFQRTEEFNRVCSAMDILDDTIFALQSYTEHDHQNQGLAYLEIFGVLQSLTVQQDAVMELHKAIVGSPINLESAFPDIKEVREIRVRVAGHPVTGRNASHFIVRHSVSKWGFELWRFGQNNEHVTAHVNLLSLIKKNANALKGAMGRVMGHIEAENNAHKAQFSSETLETLFNTSSYFASKLFAEGPTEKRPLAPAGVAMIREQLNKFQKALFARGEHYKEADFVTHDIPKLEFALNWFEKFINDTQERTANEEYIVASFIGDRLAELKKIAREVDDDYKL